MPRNLAWGLRIVAPYQPRPGERNGLSRAIRIRHQDGGRRGSPRFSCPTRDTVIRAYMAGAILALAAWFAVTINVQTGQPLVGAMLFPVGFSISICWASIC